MNTKTKRKIDNGKKNKKMSSQSHANGKVVDLGRAGNFKGLIQIAEKFLDKDTLDDFTVYLQENADKLNNPLLFKEKLRYGSPWMEKNLFMSEQGIANPEMIPVETFDKMKLDGQIAIGLAAIKQPIMGLSFRIECDNEKEKAFAENTMKKIWRQFLSGCLTSLDYGFAVMEKIYEIKHIKIEKKDVSDQETDVLFNEEAIVLKKLKNPHPKTIRFKFHKKTQEVTGLIQTSFGMKKEKLKVNKFIIYTNEGQFGNVYGKSRLAFAYTFWYWSLITYQFMLRYLERRGTPPTVMRHPVGTTADPADLTKEIDNSDLAFKAGQSLLSNSVLTFPSERDTSGEYIWDAQYLQDEPRQEMFIEVLNHLHTMKLRALYVPERVLTQDFGTGSFALADAHFNVHQQVQEGLISCIEAKANEVLKEIVSFNFIPDEIRDCVLKIERLDFAKRTVFRDIMVHLMRMNNNFAKAGILPRFVPDMREIAKLLEIPTNTVEDLYTEGTFPIPGTAAYQGVIEEAKKQAGSGKNGSSKDPKKFPESKGSKSKQDALGKPELSDELMETPISEINTKLVDLTDAITKLTTQPPPIVINLTLPKTGKILKKVERNEKGLITNIVEEEEDDTVSS